MHAEHNDREDAYIDRSIWLRVADVGCHAAIVGGVIVWLMTLLGCGSVVLGERVWQVVGPFGGWGLAVSLVGLFAAALVQWSTGYAMRCFRSKR
jgi:hypothetical protein